MAAESLHAVILAAGLGQRLWPLTRDTPKPLIDLGEGRTILGSQLHVLEGADPVGDVTIVTGHLSSQIDAFVASRAVDSTHTRFNPFFHLAGPLGSIWAVRDIVMGSDCLLANGDTVFEPELLSVVLERSVGDGIFLVGSRCEALAPDDVGVDCAGTLIERVGKGLEGAQARSSGILVITGAGARERAVAHLDQIVRDGEALSAPWHGWVHHMATRGVDVEFIAVDEGLWTEVDLHPELDDLRAELASQLRRGAP